MERLRNYEKTACGVGFALFTVIKNQKKSKYYYYISAPWHSSLTSDRMIYKGKSKSLLLNKYTLSVLAIIYTILLALIVYPVTVIVSPIYMYFDGGRNFVRDTAWAQNVRYFNLCNIFIILILLVLIVYRW